MNETLPLVREYPLRRIVLSIFEKKLSQLLLFLKILWAPREVLKGAVKKYLISYKWLCFRNIAVFS